MQINEYQRLAMVTANEQCLFNKRKGLMNGALGLCGESGEVADIIKKVEFQGHELDEDKVIKELGDVCWYVALVATSLGVDMEQIMIKNIAKLKARYPEGFDSYKSINRPENK